MLTNIQARRLAAVLSATVISLVGVVATSINARAGAVGGICLKENGKVVCRGMVQAGGNGGGSAGGGGSVSGGGGSAGGGGADFNPSVYNGPALPPWAPILDSLPSGGWGADFGVFKLSQNPVTGMPMITYPPPAVPANGAPAGAPAGPPAKTVTISPAQIAQMAYAKITLPKPTIGSAPCTRANCKGAVGLPVWLWTDPANWTPQTASASLGGVSVNVSAKPRTVTWSMGDGGTVTCTKAGTKYSLARGFASSPDCGYRYLNTSLNQPGGRYTIQATATYNVVFSGAFTATLSPATSSTTTVAITEYQAIVER